MPVWNEKIKAVIGMVVEVISHSHDGWFFAFGDQTVQQFFQEMGIPISPEGEITLGKRVFRATFSFPSGVGKDQNNKDESVRFQEAIAAGSGNPPEQIDILRIKPDEIIFQVPEPAADRIVQSYRKGRLLAGVISISKLEVLDDHEFKPIEPPQPNPRPPAKIGRLDMNEVYSWLNAGELSSLSLENALHFKQLEDAKTAAEQKTAILQILRLNAETGGDLERAEIKARLGKYYFQFYRSSNLQAAILNLRDAGEIYTRNTKRHATLLWMRGLAARQAQNHILSHQLWTEAITTFETLRNTASPAAPVLDRNWFEQRLERMYVERVKTVEETYTWLNRWETSSIDESTRGIFANIEKALQGKEYPRISNYLETLNYLTTRPNYLYPFEIPEIFAAMGLTYYRMGQSRTAAACFQRAIGPLMPRPYAQAVVKWMFGLALWEIRAQASQAFENWRGAIQVFHAVAEEAERDGKHDKHDWLKRRETWMQAALTSYSEDLLVPR